MAGRERTRRPSDPRDIGVGRTNHAEAPGEADGQAAAITVTEVPAWLPRGGAAGRPASGRSLRARGEEMVRRLLEAGRASFAARGYDAARVDDIVELAGASHGTFYLYFRNKEDLLHRLAIECAQELRPLIDELTALPRPPELRELTAWVARFSRANRRHGPVLRVWLDRRDLDPLMQELANDVLGSLARALGDLTDPATAEALSPDVTSLGLLSLLERLGSYLAAGDSHLDEGEVVATQARLLHGAMRRTDRVQGRGTAAEGRRAGGRDVPTGASPGGGRR